MCADLPCVCLWCLKERLSISVYIFMDQTCSHVNTQIAFNSVIHRSSWSGRVTDTSLLLLLMSLSEKFMPTSMPLSSCLLLNPLENSPPKVLWYAMHQSHTNERHYTLQSVWFKDDLQPFASAARNRNLPRDKLGIHLQYSKDIKGFKLCIGGVAVRTTEIGFYQMSNFHNRVRGLWVIMIPESMAAFMICSWAYAPHV